MSVAAQVLVLVGFIVMGWLSPGYGMMLVFMFVHSLGMHFFMPLNDAISMDLAEQGKVGTTLGRFKGVTTLFNLAAAVLVFFGFRTGFFSFHTRTILPFAIGGICTAGAVVLLALMAMSSPRGEGVKNHKLLFRKRYMPYYMVTLAYGCQKRIKIVFAPWVVINLLGQGADTVALLTIAVHLAGTWMAPVIGRREEDASAGGAVHRRQLLGDGLAGRDAGRGELRPERPADLDGLRGLCAVRPL